MLAIYKRELKSFFSTPQAYVFLALFVCITGIFFTIIDLAYGYNDFVNYVLSNSFYLIFTYAIVLPILTMRLFAEEKKNRTDQLLLTAPVRVWEIVLGKYLASLTVYMVGLVIITIFPIIIEFYGDLPISNTIGGYAGMILFAMAMLAFGTMISSMTAEPIIAMIISAFWGLFVLFFNNLIVFIPDGIVVTFIFFAIIAALIAFMFWYDTGKVWISIVAFLVCAGIIVAIYFLNKDWFAYGVTNSLNWLSLEKRYEELINGIFNLSSIVYMMSVTAICLLISSQVIERRRWK